ncbi:MAG TPA: hypothetical protein VM890_13980 [Longimicrobium sp.]|jgi:hypothetical protein|nr:hypothetical protein [Longimicrobium sp.]
MPKTPGRAAKTRPKRRFSRTVTGLRKMLGRAKKSEGRHWFDHPEMQARVAEAEADFLNGRSYHTDSPEAVQALFDSWK